MSKDGRSRKKAESEWEEDMDLIPAQAMEQIVAGFAEILRRQEEDRQQSMEDKEEARLRREEDRLKEKEAARRRDEDRWRSD
jgi:predicted ATPase